jgi:lipid A 3-O-deacylase
MIILFCLLIFQGCGRKSHLKNPVRHQIHEIQPVSSRFQDILISSERNSPSVIPAIAPHAYYLPGFPVGKILPVNDHDLSIQNKGPESISFRKRITIFSRSTNYLKAGSTSGESYFTTTFDNDIFDYTDYYYTNGAGFEFYHPVISALPFARLLPGINFGINYYGITLVQNIYTPLKLNKPDILYGDRPFAAYLVLGHHRISLSPESKRRLHSEFTIGVIGPGSLGNFSQAMIHSEEPTGWKYQVKNDIVVNYSIRFDQGLYSGKGIEIAALAGGQAGTLYDNLYAGFFMQVGRANDRYNSIFQTSDQQKPYRKRVRYYFSLDISNKLILYDATLQGGMFNRESVYTIEPGNINRYVFIGIAGFGLGLGSYSLEAEQVFLSPEFEGGRRHMWFRIKNIVRIN